MNSNIFKKRQMGLAWLSGSGAWVMSDVTTPKFMFKTKSKGIIIQLKLG